MPFLFFLLKMQIELDNLQRQKNQKFQTLNMQNFKNKALKKFEEINNFLHFVSSFHEFANK